MQRSKRRELFWLLLIAGCVALFVARRDGHADSYDQLGLTELVRETQSEPVAKRQARNDAIVTGSVKTTSAVPVRRPSKSDTGFYVPLGSYGSIDQATRRYLDVALVDPSLERTNKLRIETVSVEGDATFHKVRMGNFVSEKAAKNACSKAGISSALCLVVAAR
ncbi:MAG: SPOR domain-containing protein [Parvibaculum sp.]|nr:SPOR domain-containing protein [Parvibaculum sp.]